MDDGFVSICAQHLHKKERVFIKPNRFFEHNDPYIIRFMGTMDGKLQFEVLRLSDNHKVTFDSCTRLLKVMCPRSDNPQTNTWSGRDNVIVLRYVDEELCPFSLNSFVRAIRDNTIALEYRGEISHRILLGLSVGKYPLVVEDHKNRDKCAVCDQEGELMACGSCDKWFHPVCVNIRKIPREDWFCTDCVSGLYGNDVRVQEYDDVEDDALWASVDEMMAMTDDPEISQILDLTDDFDSNEVSDSTSGELHKTEDVTTDDLTDDSDSNEASESTSGELDVIPKPVSPRTFCNRSKSDTFQKTASNCESSAPRQKPSSSSSSCSSTTFTRSYSEESTSHTDDGFVMTSLKRSASESWHRQTATASTAKRAFTMSSTTTTVFTSLDFF